MNGINKAIILGTVGKDPESRFFPNGDAVTTISVATTESWTDKQTGEMVKKTEWHRIKFTKKLAEVVSKYITKGSQIYVEGKITTEKWKDANDNEKSATVIVGHEMQMLGGKTKDEQSQQPIARAASAPPRQKAPAQQQMNVEPAFLDDDIPF